MRFFFHSLKSHIYCEIMHIIQVNFCWLQNSKHRIGTRKWQRLLKISKGIFNKCCNFDEKSWFAVFFFHDGRKRSFWVLTSVLCNRHPYSIHGIFPKFFEQKTKKMRFWSKIKILKKKNFSAVMVRYFWTPKLAKCQNPPM